MGRKERAWRRGIGSWETTGGIWETRWELGVEVVGPGRRGLGEAKYGGRWEKGGMEMGDTGVRDGRRYPLPTPSYRFYFKHVTNDLDLLLMKPKINTILPKHLA